MKDKTHMKKRWPTWKCEVEKRLHAYLTSSTPPYEDYPECPESYDIWGEYYQNGRSPEEAVNDFKSGKMRPKPLVEYWYIMLNSAINILKNDKGHESFTTLMARDYLKPLEKHDILPKSEMQSIEDWWLTGDYNAVMMLLTRKRDNYVNPAPLPATLDEAAQAATVLLRCDTKDLTKWTGGLWTERGLWADRAVRLGLKAICEKQRKAIRYEITAKNNDTRINSFVLAHVENMPPEQWDYFRQHNDDNMTKRDVIRSSLMRSGGMSMKQYLECLPEALQIGAIDKSPVYFSPERGIYIWEPPESEDPFVREIWLTYPIIPKDWS